MKKKLWRLIAIIAVIGFVALSCDNGTTGEEETPPSVPSLNGVWQSGSLVAHIDGDGGNYVQLPSATVWTDAVNKNYVKVGDPVFRNLSKTGDLTWTGQIRTVTYNYANTNVATGMNWANCTITLNTNGQSFQVNAPSTDNPMATFTKSTRTSSPLDGLWATADDDFIISINGATGHYTKLSTSAVWLDAVNKNMVKVGDEALRNINRTGDLTWTAQGRAVTYNYDAQNVATGMEWPNCTITLSTNGQSFQVNTGSETITFTKKP